MERDFARREESRGEKRVRFRVASARSGRVLREVFREEEEEEVMDDSADSDTTTSVESERASSPVLSEANSHLSGLVSAEPDDSGTEPDELLMYASVAGQPLFSSKRVVIFSKNGTVRGVRDKVSAGQVLFNNLSKLYGTSLHGSRPKRR